MKHSDSYDSEPAPENTPVTVPLTEFCEIVKGEIADRLPELAMDVNDVFPHRISHDTTDDTAPLKKVTHDLRVEFVENRVLLERGMVALVHITPPIRYRILPEGDLGPAFGWDENKEAQKRLEADFGVRFTVVDADTGESTTGALYVPLHEEE